MPDPKNKQKPDDPFDDDDWGPESEGGGAATDEIPEPSADTSYYPFLKPSMVKDSMGTLELVGMADDPGEFSEVAILVKYHGSTYRIGFKLFSEDYKRLAAHFGKKKADWHGTLAYKIRPHKGNPRGYIAVKPKK